MTRIVSRERLLYLMGFVGEALTEVDRKCGPHPQFGREGYSFEASDAWWRKRSEAFEHAKDRLASEGATFTFKAAHDHIIRLAGIRSSSTSGWQGALGNWIRAAEKQLEKEASR